MVGMGLLGWGMIHYWTRVCSLAPSTCMWIDLVTSQEWKVIVWFKILASPDMAGVYIHAIGMRLEGILELLWVLAWDIDLGLFLLGHCALINLYAMKLSIGPSRALSQECFMILGLLKLPRCSWTPRSVDLCKNEMQSKKHYPPAIRRFKGNNVTQ